MAGTNLNLPDASDHAFACGPVFSRPHGFYHAYRLTGGIRYARLIRAVWNQFEGNAAMGRNIMLGVNARLINQSEKTAVSIGDFCAVRAIIKNEPRGKVEIGGCVYLGDNVIISSAAQVTIGQETLLAHGVNIFDNDTHPLGSEERAAHFRYIVGREPFREFPVGSAAIVIGERCWIGMNSLVMKGVTIGSGTVVAAGSVVVNDLQPGVLAAGNPARMIRRLN
jgi:acetyltransferase-like isoleucine patch superfamily enzyme